MKGFVIRSIEHVLAERRYLFFFFVRWLEWWCVCVGLFRPCGRNAPRYYQSHNACLESRGRLQRICVCQPLRTLVGSSGNVITQLPTQLISSMLTDVFSKGNSIAWFYKIIIRKSIFSFVQIVIQMSSIGVDFFIPKFYIIAVLSFALESCFKICPLRARIFLLNVPYHFLSSY